MTVGGFAFQLSIANSAIDFADVTDGTVDTYIFSKNSLFGPTLSSPGSGQTISASDVFSVPFSGTSLTPGETLGLGHVSFDVSENAAAGMFPVDVAPYPVTSLADSAGNNLDIDVLSPGQITITGTTATPEPSSFVLVLGLGITAIGCARRRRRSH